MYGDKCSYCGRILIQDTDSDIIDGKGVAWYIEYCPTISELEENENISDEFGRLEMAKHDGG